MGICCSCYSAADAEIESHMLQHKETSSCVRKLLLLGSSSSGKSTLFKQLKSIFNEWGLDDSEYYKALLSIRQNCVNGILKLLQKSQDIYDLDPILYNKCLINPDKDENIKKEIQIIFEFRYDTFENLEDVDWKKLQRLGEAIDYIWNNVKGIRETFDQRGSKFSFADNMEYFFDKSKSIFCEDFYPSYEDALKCRIRTSGMEQVTYEIKETFFDIYDVGGQRNERKKWIHLFEGVTAVIYVAALSHFDEVCCDDESENAMHESIYLFNEIVNSKWFEKKAIILYLNKNDLFREKLMDFINIDYCFSRERSGWEGEEYNGPLYKESDYKQSDEIINQQYFEYCYKSQTDFISKIYCHQKKNKKIYIHITNATDRNNIEKVFWDCQNIVIRKNLYNGGFY